MSMHVIELYQCVVVTKCSTDMEGLNIWAKDQVYVYIEYMNRRFWKPRLVTNYKVLHDSRSPSSQSLSYDFLNRLLNVLQEGK